MRWPFLLSLLLLSSCVSIYGLRTEKEGIHFFSADHEAFRLMGRVDTVHQQFARCWAPGTAVEVGFTGTFCEIEIQDEVKFGTYHNYIEVVIDDLPPRRIQLKAERNVILIADDLPDTKHTLLICKNTEASIGYIEFVGMSCESVFPLPARERSIEFIGDSITCGNGCDDSQITCGEGLWYDQHNAYLSFGCVLSRRLDANWLLTAVSGIGMTRSCCGSIVTMPEVYERVDLRKNGEIWKQPEKDPDLVVITLGQNDGLQDSVIFCEAYIDFLKSIRKRYQASTIICCASPMADAELKPVMKNYVFSIAEALNKAGDSKVRAFSYQGMYRTGCTFHPTAGEHRSIADELEPFVRQTMGW
ncbi:MAG TPA: SGNH/GDSL hydrolase family protein [Fluviicola sp.]|nr:SGNH/GDSL hydrolase family protein [Fluviicola sp.]